MLGIVNSCCRIRYEVYSTNSVIANIVRNAIWVVATVALTSAGIVAKRRRRFAYESCMRQLDRTTTFASTVRYYLHVVTTILQPRRRRWSHTITNRSSNHLGIIHILFPLCQCINTTTNVHIKEDKLSYGHVKTNNGWVTYLSMLLNEKSNMKWAKS